MKIPQTTGDSYADIVTWQWNRKLMRWTALLRDGTELIVQWQQRRARGHIRGYWTQSVYHSDAQKSLVSHQSYQNADLAQNAALEAWRRIKLNTGGRRTTNIKLEGPSRRRDPKRRRGPRKDLW